MAISSEQWDVLIILTTIISSLSVLCSTATIIIFFVFPRFRTGVSEIFLCSCISEVICGLAFALGRYGPNLGLNNRLCQIQGFAVEIGTLGTVICSACIATDLMLLICYGVPSDTVQKIHRRFYFPIYLIVPLSVGIPLFWVYDNAGNTFYGDAILWCWISPSFAAFRLYLLYIPLWIIFGYNLMAYIRVGRIIWKRAEATNQYIRTGNSDYKIGYAKKVSLYLLVFILVWLPGTINRTYVVFHPNDPSFALNMLQVFFTPALGILNFAVYVYVSYGNRYTHDKSTSKYTEHSSNQSSSARRVQANTHIASLNGEYGIKTPNNLNGFEEEAYEFKVLTLDKGDS